MVVEQHPTLVNVTLHPSKVKILLSSLSNSLNVSHGKAVWEEPLTESKPPYNYYTPSHLSMSDDPQLMTVSDTVSYFIRDDHTLLTSFWGLNNNLASTHFSFNYLFLYIFHVIENVL